MLLLIALGTWSEALVETAIGQTAAPSETPRLEVALLNLYPPVYPPLARQARIMGDVKIQLEIRQDGTVASAQVFSGHPMLKQAALDSAQKSTFECQGCSGVVTSYSLTYTFEVGGDCRFGPNCEALEPRPPEVAQSQGRITIKVEPWCTCDPAAARNKVRSAKCLYLWRCGFRDVPDQ
ncbi:MAG: energy transducer TonB [Candidatus Sulfotelmatobacter sp.]